MAVFLKKGLFFLILNISIFAGWVFALQRIEGQYINWETDSNILAVPENKEFDLLIFGTSRGRALTRFKNHLRMENILNMRIINLSKVGGGGPVWTRIFLDYFYSRNNSADIILYFIDPWVLYSEYWNESLCSAILNEEPFRYRFFYNAAFSGIRWSCLIKHVRNYLTKKWYFESHDALAYNKKTVVRIDPMAVKERIRGLYPEGVGSDVFGKYIRIVDEIIDRVKKKGVRIIFVLPPTLLGIEPGTNLLTRALKSYADTDGIAWFNFSDAIKETEFFADHDHLNTAGVEFFTKKYLLPVLRNTDHNQIL